MTQCEIIKQMTVEGWVSPLDAYRETGSMRLGARIWDLRQEGVVFEERTLSAVGRFGRNMTWKEFRQPIKKPEQGDLFV